MGLIDESVNEDKVYPDEIPEADRSMFDQIDMNECEDWMLSF